MGEKVLLTGVARFIGSHLAERLIKEGFEGSGIDSVDDYCNVLPNSIWSTLTGNS